MAATIPPDRTPGSQPFGNRVWPYVCIVTVMAEPDIETPHAEQPRETPPEVVPEAHADAVRHHAEEQLAQLRFLHRVARLVTTARTWDELMETVVDETRDALRAAVSSLYLLDRDRIHLTLAATNGLDRYQIGRARVPFGEGVTGRVAASREPLVIDDVGQDPRFLWVRGIDQRRFIASMLSVPLVWGDETVGVLNVQTEEPRRFGPSDAAHLRAIADLLAGVVEKGRLQREAETRAAELIAIDEARAELIALVTHELRTPLAVVRAYVDMLADEPELGDRESRDPERRARRALWYEGTIDQVERLDRLVDSILASVRVEPDHPAQVITVDVRELAADVLNGLAPLLGAHRLVVASDRHLHALADPPRLRQIVEHLLENAVKYAPPGTAITVDWMLVEGVVRFGVSDEGPGIPPEWRERIFEPYARRDTQTARGSGIGLYAAKRLGESMGARLWCEPTPGHSGARFVVALPAAVSV
jgi:signal transduction histidine kinase